jgi:hypothetical protein
MIAWFWSTSVLLIAGLVALASEKTRPLAAR